MRKILIMLIRAYQIIFSGAPRSCRFEPSCSEYAIHAISRYGALKGTGMSIWRILRCNPWSSGGYDPVR